MEAQNTKAAPFVRHEWAFGGLSNQVAHGLAERHPMALGMGFRDFHRIVLELECRSRHGSIISCM